MKKILILFSCLIFSISISAELKYFKFMGIPMGQKIDTFSQALKKKGFSLSPENSYYDLGTRVFDGYFFDENCTIFVLYERPKELRTVYTVVVKIKRSSKDYIDHIATKIKETIENKYIYNYHYLNTKSEEGLQCIYNIYNTKDKDDVIPVGRISMGVSYNSDESLYELTIFYKDFMLCVLNDIGKESDI